MANDSSDSDPRFQLIPFTPPTPNVILETFNPLPLNQSPSIYNQNPKKKRTKISKNHSTASSTSSPKPPSRPKYSKKPDPSAPKITRPCTECGKQFWSWKALFGHMRCHPEREWRGINPPPNYRRTVSPTKQQLNDDWVSLMSADDHDVASCLLMLSNSAGLTASTATDIVVPDSRAFSFRTQENDSSSNSPLSGPSWGYRFECGGCKKVFGSHQALGGHRASHKNVKGCFAITRSCDIHDTAFNEPVGNVVGAEDQKKTVTFSGHHKCNLCYRVFSSGQALGGHMRCHWERSEDEPQVFLPSSSNFIAALDLNVPVTTENDSSSSSSDTTGLSLDLRLGL